MVRLSNVFTIYIKYGMIIGSKRIVLRNVEHFFEIFNR